MLEFNKYSISNQNNNDFYTYFKGGLENWPRNTWNTLSSQLCSFKCNIKIILCMYSLLESKFKNYTSYLNKNDLNVVKQVNSISYLD